MVLFCAFVRAESNPPIPSTGTVQTATDDKPKEFAPGVHIDWTSRTVEVAAEVVLREGPLELLACSPRTREHESILVVHARPMHIFQALGLVGVEPGSPVRYDEENDRWLPPAGTPLSIRIRYQQDGTERTVRPEAWLASNDAPGKKPPRLNWIFAGSRTLANGRFGADVDGTVICVVDFETAMITVGALHSADNELLWLRTDTDAIPRVGTKCSILIRKLPDRMIEIAVLSDGKIRYDGRERTIGDFLHAARKELGEEMEIGITLTAAAGVPESAIREVVLALGKAGVREVDVEVRRTDAATTHGE